MKILKILSASLLIAILLVVIIVVSGFQLVPAKIDDSLLEGSVICDSSLVNPNYYPVSQVESVDTSKHVVLLVHGFGASTFEWREFHEFLIDNNSTALSSLVLLGAHGRDYETFKRASWQEWRAPILKEYRALVEKGFKNISIYTASTGGTLVLSLIYEGLFDGLPAPKNIVMIDPFLYASDKRLPWVNYVGPIIGNLHKKYSDERKPYLYSFIHYSAIIQLNNLSRYIDKGLERGIHLPSGTHFEVFTAKGDHRVDIESSTTIVKGVTLPSGEKGGHTWVESTLHVFTNIAGKEPVKVDIDNQINVFKKLFQLLH